MGHRLDLTFDAGVVVGDHGNVDIAKLELTDELCLRRLGHVDGVPAGASEVGTLGSGGKARTLNDDHGAAVMGPGSRLPACGHGQRPQF